MKWTMFMLDTAECDNTSENVVLCNTLNGAVITMKRDLYEYSRSLRNAQLQEYYQRNNAENDYTNLCDSDFLIAESKDEKKDFMEMLNTQWTNDERIDIHFLPTSGCNFKCPYCYQDGIKRNYNMSNADVSIILGKLRHYLDNNKNITQLRVTLHGGEPTLNWEIVPAFLSGIKEISDERNAELYVTIVTNGYLLDKYKADLLSRFHWVRLQVTIDGLKETHNKRRALRNGDPAGSFDTIIKNISYVLDNDLIEHVNIRINYDENNIQEVKATAKYLSQMFDPGRIMLSFGNISQTVSDTGAFEYIENNIIGQEDFVKSYLEVYEYAFNLGFDLGESFSFSAMCVGKMKHSFVLSSDGNVYTCLSTVGREELRSGQWRGDEELTSRSLMNYSLYDECFKKKCPLIPLCHCDCRFDALVHEENINSIWCRKNILEPLNKSLLTIIYKDYLHNSTSNKSNS